MEIYGMAFVRIEKMQKRHLGKLFSASQSTRQASLDVCWSDI